MSEPLPLRERIDTALKTAMKARDDKTRVATLRLINAAIKDRDIAARGEDRCDGATEEEILGILTKMVRQREESSASFEAGGRPELAEQERAEIEIIRDFMPRQMDASEVEAAVADVVAEIEATSLKDMGKCMGTLKARHQGAMDFGQAGKILKAKLSGKPADDQ
ncbi:MAG: GatB/YqeY domain-containing protein [Pseudomonadota bacterium]